MAGINKVKSKARFRGWENQMRHDLSIAGRYKAWKRRQETANKPHYKPRSGKAVHLTVAEYTARILAEHQAQRKVG